MEPQGSEHGSQRLTGKSRVSNSSRSSLGKKRPVACRRCHAQKARCSGEMPCSKCCLAGCESECSYVVRDRKVRVDESYLEQLIRDSEELHQSKLNSPTTVSLAGGGTSVSASHTPILSEPETRNPIMHDRAWFESHHEWSLPIFVSEVSCTAFATRLCQYLTADNSVISHMPRMKYTNQGTLNAISQAGTPWPSLARARLLVNTAIGHANPQFHLTLRKRTVDCLDGVYQTEAFSDPSNICKSFALFALGETCSMSVSRSSDGEIPGIAYYARAISLIPLLPERPSIAHIEALVILSLYSQFLNRWHSAYTMIGTALRLGLAMGLHHNIPAEQCPDPILRESRVRLWWNIYIFDRFWALKLGLPVQIDDTDIQVNLPSDLDVPGYRDEFVDASYQLTVIELARISSNIMRSIYSWRAFEESFLQREQRILIELQQWLGGLPDRFQLQTGGQNPKFTTFIHLQFNYCVNLAIRPILLSMLNQLKTTPSNTKAAQSPGLTALCEACIHSARHTMALCAEEWTRGSLSIFGYAFAQYIFTASLVLIISSLLPFGTAGDREYVMTASEMLSCLVAGGSLVADDLYIHLQRVQVCLENSSKFASSLPASPGISQTPLSAQQMPVSASVSGAVSQPPRAATQANILDSHVYPTPGPNDFIPDPHFATPDMAAPYQAMMQDFLGQSVSSIDLLEPVDFPVTFMDSSSRFPLWDSGRSF
ncbi:fungal-specific transcription factor domain-containing protein [Aspergillus insuetus]